MDRLQELLADGIIDEVYSQLKTGKEAEVWLVSHKGEPVAAKLYKEREFRSFKNDAGYKEGRTVRNTRTQRAMDKGSKFGREAAEEAWKSAEADALFALHQAGVRVPKPVLFYDGVLLMEVIGDAEGRVAPRLVEANITLEQAAPMYRLLRGEIIKMLSADWIHGDLSEFNILLGANGPVIIDFPQVVTAAKNSQSEQYFRRDMGNMLRFFGGYDPTLATKHAGDADEIWRAYVRRHLSRDFEPSGRVPGPPRHAQRGGPSQGRGPGGPQSRGPDQRGPGGQQARDQRGPGGPQARGPDQRGPGGQQARDQRGPGGPQARGPDQRVPGQQARDQRGAAASGSGDQRGPGGPQARGPDQRGPGGPQTRGPGEQRGPGQPRGPGDQRGPGGQSRGAGDERGPGPQARGPDQRAGGPQTRGANDQRGPGGARDSGGDQRGAGGNQHARGPGAPHQPSAPGGPHQQRAPGGQPSGDRQRGLGDQRGAGPQQPRGPGQRKGPEVSFRGQVAPTASNGPSSSGGQGHEAKRGGGAHRRRPPRRF